MKKKLIIGIISVLLILTGVGYGVGSFFVHYALSPVSDSAKRNINEEDKIDTAKGTEKVILQNQKKEQKKATGKVGSENLLSNSLAKISHTLVYPQSSIYPTTLFKFSPDAIIVVAAPIDTPWSIIFAFGSCLFIQFTQQAISSLSSHPIPM